MSYSCVDTIARTVWREDIVGPSHAVRTGFLSCAAHIILLFTSKWSLSLSLSSLYRYECHVRLLLLLLLLIIKKKKSLRRWRHSRTWSRCSVTTSVFGKNNSTQLLLRYILLLYAYVAVAVAAAYTMW